MKKILGNVLEGIIKFLRFIVIIKMIIIMITMWIFPILLSIYEDNYWFLLSYIIWWFPAIIITCLIIIFIPDEL